MLRDRWRLRTPLLDQVVHSFVTFLVIVDPIGVAVIFATLTHQATGELGRRIAWRATVVAGSLILIFGCFGESVLHALGVSMPAFRIAGGILLFLLATDMTFARPSGIRAPTEPEQAEASRTQDISVFPLAFPLLAGPGALTSVVLAVGGAHGGIELAGVAMSVVAVLALALAALLAANGVTRLLGITGANVVGRVSGVILAALATQYVVDGLADVIGRR
jgi:multiple antibiotic resistance protein